MYALMACATIDYLVVRYVSACTNMFHYPVCYLLSSLLNLEYATKLSFPLSISLLTTLSCLTDSPNGLRITGSRCSED